jgi:glycerophosphoryl diester phosphodiesterase
MLKLPFRFFFLFYLLLYGCTAQKITSGMVNEFDKQGHRGCRGLMPENTLPAMVEALNLGVTTIELDVVITKDEKVLVSHEPWFNPDITTLPGGFYLKNEKEGKALNIYKMTYAETRSYDVGLKPYPRFPDQKRAPAYKPLLSEVIDTINAEMMTRRRPPMRYNIELKVQRDADGIYQPEPKRFIDLVMEVVNRYGLESYVNIQSFDFRPLQYLRQKYPPIPIAILIDGQDDRSLDEQIKRLGFTPEIYSPYFALVNRTLIDDCHSRGIKIIPWTVNKKEKIMELREMGVDGIITDYPNLF